MSRIRIAVLVFLITGTLIFAGYKFRSGHVTASATAEHSVKPVPVNEDLRRFMQARVHQEYTFLSFTIWHDKPLTPAKMDSITKSTAKMMDMAKELNNYEAVYREQGWTDEDVKYFEEKRLQLSRVVEELNHASQKHDSQEVVNFFLHLDSTCQSCHRRFRPDLQWL
jgi:cytochrome c556